MSELQIALLLIAGAVLAGLYLAGKWQERRVLRRLGEEFGGGVGDALLSGPDVDGDRAQPAVPARTGGASRRIEPRLSPGAAADEAEEPAGEVRPAPPVAAARRSDWVEDPMLDCVLELRCARPVDGVSFIDAAMPLTASRWPMPVSFVVWDARAQQWVHPDRFGYYTDALAAIQIANRRTVLGREQIDRFVEAARQVASALDADCDPPDAGRIAAGAHELDRLCARFDVRIGLTLESAEGAWSETQVSAAAAQAGLQPDGDLRWAPPHDAGPAPLTLAMPGAVAGRILLELDVPTIASGAAAVQQMFHLGSRLGAQLNARIVDDNGRPIDSESVDAIEVQLEKLYGEMRSAGIDPGGERARRLYV